MTTNETDREYADSVLRWINTEARDQYPCTIVKELARRLLARVEADERIDSIQIEDSE